MNVDREQARRVASVLSRIRSGDRHKGHGICYCVRYFQGMEGLIAPDVVTRAALLWPDRYTGLSAARFPVGGEREYQREQWEHTVWDNPRRMALLDWLIDYFERAQG